MVSGDFSPAAQKNPAGGIVKAIFYFLWTGVVLWRPPTAPHTFPERSEILKNGSGFAEGMDAPASLGFLGLLHGILGTEALRKSVGKVEESPGWPLGSLPRTPVMLPSGSRPNGWNGPRGRSNCPRRGALRDAPGSNRKKQHSGPCLPRRRLDVRRLGLWWMERPAEKGTAPQRLRMK